MQILLYHVNSIESSIQLMVDYEMFNKIDSEKLSTAVYTVNELTMTSICQ